MMRADVLLRLVKMKNTEKWDKRRRDWSSPPLRRISEDGLIAGMSPSTPFHLHVILPARFSIPPRHFTTSYLTWIHACSGRKFEFRDFVRLEGATRRNSGQKDLAPIRASDWGWLCTHRKARPEAAAGKSNPSLLIVHSRYKYLLTAYRNVLKVKSVPLPCFYFYPHGSEVKVETAHEQIYLMTKSLFILDLIIIS